MNAPDAMRARVAHDLTTIADQLVSSRPAFEQSLAEDERRDKDRDQDRFEKLLRDFIVNDGYRFPCGGLHNLLRITAGICEELSQVEGDDWEKAAQAVDAAGDVCDLKFGR
jgi:hypothetical protein